MGRKKRLREKDLIEAIKGSSGFISTIAARLHCNWHTVDNAIKASEKAREAMADEEETTIDFVEGQAIKKIKEGDGSMIRFYLATKGKKRGYTTEDKLEDEAGTDNEINVICDGNEVAPVDPDGGNNDN